MFNPLVPMLRSLTALVTLSVVSQLMAIEHSKDSVDTIKARVQQGQAVLLDVREQDEWDAGHLKDARLLPLSDLKAGTANGRIAELLPPGKIVYCHCKSGGRVLPAGEILQKLGYDVRPLKQGYQDLLRLGFEKE
jgi:rhodanese-related sulfurtransferase